MFCYQRRKLILRFQKIKQIFICKLNIVLNILCQFYVHTTRTIILNMHINFISIQFLVVDLRFLVIKIDSRFRKIKQIVICQLKTVLNILRQFSAHTSRIVMLNMHVNFINIRFLIADLGFLPIKIDFAVSKNPNRLLYADSKLYLIFCVNFLHTHQE